MRHLFHSHAFMFFVAIVVVGALVAFVFYGSGEGRKAS
jgi:hypothetical protein